ncbi:MAG: 3-deoxy-7-phosphoheptulonate synthase [Clostridiales bacterium]|nr:3-deoxy-7-phosphoheptulonate synthase [Clostridiales bacterium]
MIIVMKPTATEENINTVKNYIESLGLSTHLSTGRSITIIGIIGDRKKVPDTTRLFPGVDKLVHLTESYKLANRKFKTEPTVIDADGVKFGIDTFTVTAGPCAIESAEQMLEIADTVKQAGGRVLRCGVFTAETEDIIKEVKEKTDLKIVVEVKRESLVKAAAACADLLLVGSANMENYGILRECALAGKPVILCRGLAATIDELLNSAEYIMSNGNERVILCERGIRTYETSTRNTLDLSAVPVIKAKSHLPVVVDPSHSAFVMEYIKPLSKAAAAAGADGLIIEVHPNPAASATNSSQALNFKDFNDVMAAVKPIVQLEERTF